MGRHLPVPVANPQRPGQPEAEREQTVGRARGDHLPRGHVDVLALPVLARCRRAAMIPTAKALALR